MKYLNNQIKNGHAYRNYFPGCTPLKRLHCCEYNLEHDKPSFFM